MKFQCIFLDPKKFTNVITIRSRVSLYYYYNTILKYTIVIITITIVLFYNITMALGWTQPVTEMSTRTISWGVKAAGS